MTQLGDATLMSPANADAITELSRAVSERGQRPAPEMKGAYGASTTSLSLPIFSLTIDLGDARLVPRFSKTFEPHAGLEAHTLL